VGYYFFAAKTAQSKKCLNFKRLLMHTSISLQGRASSPQGAVQPPSNDASIVQEQAPESRASALDCCMRAFCAGAKSIWPVLAFAVIGGAVGGLPGLFIGASMGGFAVITWWLMTQRHI